MSVPVVARIYQRAALPVTLVMLSLAAAGWVLLRWQWLLITVVGCALAATGQIVFNDVAFDKVAYAPCWLKRPFVWLRANAGLLGYAPGAVAAQLAWDKTGWLWLPYVTVLAGIAAVLEVVVLLGVRRYVKLRGPRSCTRALLSSMVAVWLESTLLILLLGHWWLLPARSGVSFLHFAVPALATALLLDARSAWIFRHFWPWRV